MILLTDSASEVADRTDLQEREVFFNSICNEIQMLAQHTDVSTTRCGNYRWICEDEEDEEDDDEDEEEEEDDDDNDHYDGNNDELDIADDAS